MVSYSLQAEWVTTIITNVVAEVPEIHYLEEEVDASSYLEDREPGLILGFGLAF